MSEPALTVPTAFPDIAQLSEGLADRVDEERIMLYGPEPMEDGAWVRFMVTLADQSVAMEGMGRAVASIDGGEERPESARFDIVLDSLQLEGSSEVVYERILMVRSQAFTDQPATGEVSLEEVEEIEQQQEAEAEASAEYADAPGEVHEEHPPYEEAPSTDVAEEPEESFDAPVVDAAPETDEHAAYDEATAEPTPADFAEAAPAEGFEDAPAAEDWSSEGTDEVELADVDAVESLPPSAAPPAPPAEPNGFVIQPMGQDGRVLMRGSRQASWYPEPVPMPESAPSSGAFAFTGGLPIPAEPPRPPLDPTLRIQPAPRPGPDGAAEAPVAAEEAPADVIYAEQPGYEDGDYVAATDPEVTNPEQESPPGEGEGFEDFDAAAEHPDVDAEAYTDEAPPAEEEPARVDYEEAPDEF